MNYFTIEYKKICRKCLSTDGLNNVFSVLGDEGPYLKMKEWELSEKMLKASQHNKINCQNCGSDNYQIYETRINFNNRIFKSYDFDREANNLELDVFYMISLSKINNVISLKQGGRNNTFSWDKKDFITLLKKHVSTEPDKLYSSYPKGEFTFVASGKFNEDPNDSNLYFTIEMFYHTGFSKLELLDALERNSQVFDTDGFNL